MTPEPDTQAGGPTSLRSSISDAAQRIDEVVQAAERVAVELQEDARREAEEYLQERRADADRLLTERTGALSELSQSLVRQAEELSVQSRALAARVEEVAGEFRSVLDQGFEAPAGEPPRIALPGDGPVEAAEPSEADFDSEAEALVEDAGEESAARESGAPEEALLRATQMAISGRSRPEIAEQLRAEFELADPEELLDQVLGPEPRQV